MYMLAVKSMKNISTVKCMLEIIMNSLLLLFNSFFKPFLGLKVSSQYTFLPVMEIWTNYF